LSRDKNSFGTEAKRRFSRLFQLQQLRLLLAQIVYGELGLTYYHVYYPGEIQVSDKPQKNIVGYDSHSVYTFADHKKKPMSGNAEMRNNMVLPIDVCADFAISVR